MFGRRQGDTAQSGRVQTVIGEGTEIRGTIRSTGVMRIDGFLEGTLEHAGELVVGPQGRLVAKVRAKSLALAGEIRGDVQVEGKLELLETARLHGNISAAQLVVHEGAVFEGRSERNGQVSRTSQGPSAAAPEVPEPQLGAGLPGGPGQRL